MKLQQLNSFAIKNLCNHKASDKPAAPPPQPSDRVSLSKGAFADGASAASELVTLAGGMGAGAIGGFALGASAVAVAAAGLAVAGPVATALTVVGGACAGVLGAGACGSLAEKASAKFGQWGSKLAARLGFSEKTGEGHPGGRAGRQPGPGRCSRADGCDRWPGQQSRFEFDRRLPFLNLGSRAHQGSHRRLPTRETDCGLRRATR